MVEERKKNRVLMDIITSHGISVKDINNFASSAISENARNVLDNCSLRNVAHSKALCAQDSAPVKDYVPLSSPVSGEALYEEGEIRHSSLMTQNCTPAVQKRDTTIPTSSTAHTVFALCSKSDKVVAPVSTTEIVNLGSVMAAARASEIDSVKDSVLGPYCAVQNSSLTQKKGIPSPSLGQTPPP